MASGSIADLLGDKIVNKDGEKVSVESFTGKGKVVGLYFSAHWCPPCRSFTPKLAEYYDSKDKNVLQIVFISSDRDEAGFKDYFKSMPWLALDFEDRGKKDALCKQFGVNGIPTLVFLNGETGEVLDREGRAFVMENPDKIPS